MKTKLVLASASPRRKELLEMLGLFDLTILPARGEAPFPKGLPPAEAVKWIARQKAEDTSAQCPEQSLILAADTIVCLDGKILGKPRNKEEAAEMLHTLSGRQHTVYTGMALMHGGRVLCDVAEAQVWFRDLSNREIEAYIATGSPLDKAGAYGAQDMAALFVERIDGEFYTVVGLPLCRLGHLLKASGISLWS